MGEPNNNRDLAMLMLAIERNRVQMQRAWERAENLDATIQSSKELEKKIKDRKPEIRDEI